MARSSYIYTLFEWSGVSWELKGAFTVKYEMENFVKEHKDDRYIFIRLKDGDPSYELKIEEVV